MQTLDWILVGASLLTVLVIGVYTQQYMRSVADFLSAGRVARRYLPCGLQGGNGLGGGRLRLRL